MTLIIKVSTITPAKKQTPHIPRFTVHTYCYSGTYKIHPYKTTTAEQI